MNYSGTVKKLRFLHYTYLTLLPSAATFFILADGDVEINFTRIFVIAFLPLLVYLDVVIEIVSFPYELLKALVTTFGTPLQVFIAYLLFHASVGDFFIHEFFIEVLGVMIGILFYVFFEMKKSWKRIVFALLWFGGGFAGFVYIFLPRLLETGQGNILSAAFLISALITSSIAYIRRMKHSKREADFWPLIIVGLFTWFIAGGFGQAAQNNLK